MLFYFLNFLKFLSLKSIKFFKVGIRIYGKGQFPFYHNSLLIIPSLGQLLGYPTLGQYANSPVNHISTDTIIFWSGAEAAVKFPEGMAYFVFGVGYYYTQFQLQNHPYIIDQRDLTCLIFSDFV